MSSTDSSHGGTTMSRTSCGASLSPHSSAMFSSALDVHDPSARPYKKVLHYLSAFTVAVSIVFYVWAVVNTVRADTGKQHGLDFGAFAFAFAAFGGITGLYASAERRRLYTAAHIGMMSFGLMMVVMAYAWSIGVHNTCGVSECLTGRDLHVANLKRVVPMTVWFIAGPVFLALATLSTAEDRVEPDMRITRFATTHRAARIEFMLSWLVMAASLFFWVWSLHITATNSVDSGIVIWPLMFIAGMTGVYASRAQTPRYVTIHLVFLGVASGLMSLAYIGALAFAKPKLGTALVWVISFASWIACNSTLVYQGMKHRRFVAERSSGSLQVPH